MWIGQAARGVGMPALQSGMSAEGIVLLTDTHSMAGRTGGPARHRRICLLLLGIFCCVAFGLAGWMRWQLGFEDGASGVQPEMVDRTIIYMLIFAGAGVAGLAAMIALRRVPGIGAWAPRAALVMVTIVLIAGSDRVVGLYVKLPSVSDSMFTPHVTRGWFFRRRATGSGAGIHFSSNSLGLRNPEIDSRKAANEYRVMCTGDSVCFGYGIPKGDTWVEVAGRVCAKKAGDRTYNLINAGVSGYATWQELDLVRELDPVLNPDMVVIQFCYNDVLDMTNVEPGMLSGSQMQFLTVDSDHWSGWVRLIQTTLARREAKRLREGQLWAGKTTFTEIDGANERGAALYAEPPPAPILEGWRQCLKSMDELKDHCRKKNRAMLVVFVPVLAQLRPDGFHMAPERRLAEWCREAGVEFLDMTDDFRRAANGKEPPHKLMADDVHPGVEGCRIIGERLAEKIMQMAGK